MDEGPITYLFEGGRHIIRCCKETLLFSDPHFQQFRTKVFEAIRKGASLTLDLTAVSSLDASVGDLLLAVAIAYYDAESELVIRVQNSEPERVIQGLVGKAPKNFLGDYFGLGQVLQGGWLDKEEAQPDCYAWIHTPSLAA